MNVKLTIFLAATLTGSCFVFLNAQQAEPAAGGRGGRAGPAPATYWVAKTKGGVYVPPNQPLTKLSDLKAKHTGQATWTELVVKDPDMQAEYNSAAPGTKISRRMHPDTADVIVVVDGEMSFDIEGQGPVTAVRGSIVNIQKSTFFTYEVAGTKPALWVDINPANFKTLYPGDGPAPAAPAGAEMVKVSFGRTPPAYSGPNMPHWNLFETAAKPGPAGGVRVIEDHLYVNPIYGFADPNDPLNPNRGNPAASGRGGRGGAAANARPFRPNSVFGHMHPGPAEWWIVQSGQISGQFENTGEFVGTEGDILYAPPMMWHQMGFKGPGLSCRLAFGAYSFINMNNTASQ